VAGTCEFGSEPLHSIKWNVLIGCKPVNFPRRPLLHGVSKSFDLRTDLETHVWFGFTDPLVCSLGTLQLQHPVLKKHRTG
jgi:hypothetical protein